MQISLPRRVNGNHAGSTSNGIMSAKENALPLARSGLDGFVQANKWLILGDESDTSDVNERGPVEEETDSSEEEEEEEEEQEEEEEEEEEDDDESDPEVPIPEVKEDLEERLPNMTPRSDGEDRPNESAEEKVKRLSTCSITSYHMPDNDPDDCEDVSNEAAKELRNSRSLKLLEAAAKENLGSLNALEAAAKELTLEEDDKPNINYLSLAGRKNHMVQLEDDDEDESDWLKGMSKEKPSVIDKEELKEDDAVVNMIDDAKEKQRKKKENYVEVSASEDVDSSVVDTEEDETGDEDEANDDGTQAAAEDEVKKTQHSRRLRRPRSPPRPAAPLRPQASTETLDENRHLRLQVAEAHHRLQNRIAKSAEEVEFWRRRTLGLDVKYVIAKEETLGTWSEGEGGALAAASADHVVTIARAREELTQRKRQCQVAERQAQELQAQVTVAKQQADIDGDAYWEVQMQASKQAASLLTRGNTGPVDRFISSLARQDYQALLWVRSQIDDHYVEYYGDCHPSSVVAASDIAISSDVVASVSNPVVGGDVVRGVGLVASGYSKSSTAGDLAVSIRQDTNTMPGSNPPEAVSEVAEHNNDVYFYKADDTDWAEDDHSYNAVPGRRWGGYGGSAPRGKADGYYSSKVDSNNYNHDSAYDKGGIGGGAATSARRGAGREWRGRGGS